MKVFFTGCLLFVACLTGYSQDSTVPKAVLPGTLRVEVEPNGDTIYRGAVLPETPSRRPVYRGLIYSGRGYRIQIYSGNDRKEAIAAKTRFMRIYPSLRTYLSYTAPQFKVKAGDFKSRTDAYQIARTIQTLFKPVMIVPDVIVVNSLKH